MEPEQLAVKRRLAEEHRFRREKENIVIQLGGLPSELVSPSAPSRIRQKLDANIVTPEQPSDPLRLEEDEPESKTEEPFDHYAEDIPQPLNHSEEQNAYIEEERRNQRKEKQHYRMLIVCIVLLILIIAVISITVTTVMKTASIPNFEEDDLDIICSLDRKMLIGCKSGSLVVPPCANNTFQQFAKTLLQKNETSHPYPCESKYFGLVTLAVAQVNVKEPLEDIVQYWTLATIYFALGGPDWQDQKDWLTGKSPCDPEKWSGITCSQETSNVVSMEMIANNLRGSFPTEIALLTSLSQLRLMNNQITGEIPSEIGLCQGLKELELIQNTVSGTIPSEIGLLSNLELFELSHHLTEGSLPTQLGLLTNLRRLDLYDMVYLTGSLPSQIANLSQLSVLFIASSFDNEIVFSSFLSHLPTSLESLSLYDMPFTGSIPPSIRLFHNLTALNLNSLTLSGTLPTEIGLLTNVIKLDFSYSKLDGEIPSELGRLTHMTGLYVDGTNFEKPFPSEVLQIPGLITNH